jgi:hypothetical protein
MVGDPVRHSVLLFGGYFSGYLGDTWEWIAGVGWQNRPVSGPLGRQGASAAYDEARSRLMLFGGQSGNALIDNDTWEWDGNSWQPISVLGPSRRLLAGMAYDSQQRRVFLFGGSNNSDTWSYTVRGNTCTGGWQCNSGYCTDGVCCDKYACGTCERCDLPGHDGICTPTTGSDDTCLAPKSCVVQTIGESTVGICGYVRGAACMSPADCQSGSCVDGVCCDSVCGGECQKCNLVGFEGTCLPVPASAQSTGRGGACAPRVCDGQNPFCPSLCSSDALCAPTYYCGAGGQCLPQRTQAQTCDLAAGANCLVAGCRVCATGHCTDGVCCDSDCTDGCQDCATGTCTMRASGSIGRASCGQYLCAGQTSCATSCGSDGDCVGGGTTTFCIAQTCQGQLPLGAVCKGAGDCASGHCTDGVCCDDDCKGACHSCVLAGKQGTCSIPVGEDPEGDCAGEGACSGVCGAAGTCERPGVSTRCGMCLGCDGNGHCGAVPAAGTDDRCTPVDCGAQPVGDCWHYVARASATAGACAAPGLCATSPAEACDVAMADDGAPCGQGSCQGGVCRAPGAKPPAQGCAAAPGEQVGLASILVLLASLGFLRAARRQPRKRRVHPGDV